jgi:hypothetical protein
MKKVTGLALTASAVADSLPAACLDRSFRLVTIRVTILDTDAVAYAQVGNRVLRDGLVAAVLEPDADLIELTRVIAPALDFIARQRAADYAGRGGGRVAR